MSLEKIHASIPHRAPMLLLERIVSIEESEITCENTFSDEDFFVQGHFPDAPIVPGVIQCECGLQAGAVLLANLAASQSNGESHVETVPVATRIDNVKFKRMVRPGDTVQIQVKLKEQVSNAYFLTGKIMLDGKLATRLDFAVTMAQPEK